MSRKRIGRKGETERMIRVYLIPEEQAFLKSYLEDNRGLKSEADSMIYRLGLIALKEKIRAKTTQ